jgi:SAM-dependent methyltransferase
MEGYEAATYGERLGALYDGFEARSAGGGAETVEVLAQLVGDGRALELGIGTGRIALPLSERGVRVEGIDISPALVAQLRAKPGGDTIPVQIADFAEVNVEGRFDLIFAVYNTLFFLLTQDQQIRCFANVAEHLSDTGNFVVEALVPDLTIFDRGQRISAPEVGLQQVWLRVTLVDTVNQRIDATNIVLAETGLTLYPVAFRYAWPTELDLMARLAGLQLKSRWSSWDKQPFSADSKLHVSVYGR